MVNTNKNINALDASDFSTRNPKIKPPARGERIYIPDEQHHGRTYESGNGWEKRPDIKGGWAIVSNLYHNMHTIYINVEDGDGFMRAWYVLGPLQDELREQFGEQQMQVLPLGGETANTP